MAIITDHALLRYLERIKGMDIRAVKRRASSMGYVVNNDKMTLAFIHRSEGVDVEALRKSLITPELLAALHVGVRRMKIGRTLFIIQNGTVVTLCSADSTRPHTKRMRPVLRPGQFQGVRRGRRRSEHEIDADA